MSIPLYDDFTNALGEFPNYDTYDAAQRTQLARQKHVDLRSFQQNPVYTPYTMYAMADLTMADLSVLTMADLLDLLVTPGENWTQGTVGTQSDINHFNGLKLTCGIGATSTLSVTTPVNLSGFLAADTISLALPNFPGPDLTLASCFLDLTSNPSGNFATGPTVSLPFSTGTLATGSAPNYPSSTNYPSGTHYPGTNNDSLTWPMSAVTGIALNAVTGVRFRITATTACTFRCLAIRVLASTWDYAPIDLNTLYGRIGATVPPEGDPAQAYSFPTAAGPVSPADWPTLFFSDGDEGPTLVDIEIGAVIATGASAAQNVFTLTFREAELQTLSMTAISSQTMADLEALNQMPGTIPGTLDDFTEAKFLTGTLKWGTTTSLSIGDHTGTAYTVTGSLAANSHYYLLWTLSGNSLRGQVYPLATNGLIDWSTLVLDTTAVIDSSLIRRRRGRLGWYAQLQDGNAYVSNLRPRRVVYGEYRSVPFTSYTPVNGARLYADSSPDVGLYPGSVATPGARIRLDSTKSTSGKAIQVHCDGNLPLEGFVSGLPVRFENFYDTELEFDVLAPASAQLLVVLSGESRLIAVPVQPIPGHVWTHVRLPFETLGPLYQPGPYSVLILQSTTTQNTWYIDNLNLHTKTISWQGRSQAADPWGMNNPPWIKFWDVFNDPSNGVLLGRGDALQVRSQALSQTATVSRMKLLPQYAELGNFVWTDQAPDYGSAPVPSFTATPGADHSAAYDGSASTASNDILAYYWTFGDSAYAYGQTTSHIYTRPGTYKVTLTLIDKLGRKVPTTQSVVIT